jgi:hypothetical protein
MTNIALHCDIAKKNDATLSKETSNFTFVAASKTIIKIDGVRSKKART